MCISTVGKPEWYLSMISEKRLISYSALLVLLHFPELGLPRIQPPGELSVGPTILRNP